MSERRVGLLGATSLVGKCLLPILIDTGWQVDAFSRQTIEKSFAGVIWHQPPFPLHERERRTPYWICVAPVWSVPDYFDLLEASGVRRMVVLSSTSRFTKDDSSDLEEQAIAKRLADAEDCVQAWAEDKGVEWIILRPTLIYGLGHDKNLTEIARFIQRFGFFPVLGQAKGLRQPVHCADVAYVCASALTVSPRVNRAYNISGGETLTYRDMVKRVFRSLDLQPRFISVPLSLFKWAVSCLRVLPRYRHWSAAMAERMNRDLVFDHSDACKDLGYKPRMFVLSKTDVIPS
ncbi:MAG: NAD-dependent epimerase/dehydratase family protein [Gammaproteobacteria bacterium]